MCGRSFVSRQMTSRIFVPMKDSIAMSAISRASAERTQDWQAYLFLSLFAIPFVLFNLLPIVAGVFIAFTDFSIVGDVHWVGTSNFVEAYHDVWVWLAFKNVVAYAAIIVPSVTLLALASALYVNQKYPFSSVVRSVFFAPYVVSATVIGLIWVWVLDTQRGLLNHYVAMLGFKAIPWLTSSDWSLVGVAMASIWWDMGLSFVLLLAALQDVPGDLIDAARVDGANRLRRLYHVILPQIRPTLSMVITLQCISTLKIFSQVHVMTDGGPAGSSSSVIHYIYAVAIEQARFGYASAVGVILFGLILLVTILQRFLIKEAV
jgi:multiple sugar transport system permease protein